MEGREKNVHGLGEGYPKALVYFQNVASKASDLPTPVINDPYITSIVQ